MCMEYFILGLILLVLCITFYIVIKNKKYKFSKEEVNTSIKNSNSLVKLKVDMLPASVCKKYEIMHEVKDSNLLTHINNLIPELVQTSTSINNAIKSSSEVVYQVVIPSNTKLAKSKNMKNAVRGIYHGEKGVKGHANLVAVDQSKNAIANTVSSSMNITSMIVGQYYMSQIDNKLSEISEEINKISDFQKNEYKSKILALVSQVKRISSFQSEILENFNIKEMELSLLNNLEQKCIELLGQANLEIEGYTKKNKKDFKDYDETLSEIEMWFSSQRILMEILYKINDLKYILNLGKISKEQLSTLLNDYYTQVTTVNNKLIEWHKKYSSEFEIDVNSSRRKRKGFEGFVYYVPSLINSDLKYKPISEKTKGLIEKQSSKFESVDDNKLNLFNSDVRLISKEGKIYYIPMEKGD